MMMKGRYSFWNVALGTEAWLKWKVLFGSPVCLELCAVGVSRAQCSEQGLQGCPTATAWGSDLWGWGTDCSARIHLLPLFL